MNRTRTKLALLLIVEFFFFTSSLSSQAMNDDEIKKSIFKNFPPTHFYHLAVTSNIPSIRQHGLLSTQHLLEIANIPSSEHQAILTSHRQNELILPNGIIIRDQSPMPPNALVKVLPDNITPSDWYYLLNTYVFLWANKERVIRHWNACGSVPQSLLVFDAPKLLEELGDHIYLSPINSGYALRAAALRSPELHVPYQEWIKTGWPVVMGKQQPRTKLPIEILVKGSIPLDPYLIAIEDKK